MDVFPSYIPDDQGLRKRYEKIYRDLRYKEPMISEILSMFDIDPGKITDMYFTGSVDHVQFKYILNCMIIVVRGECKSICVKSMASTIKSFNRSEITKALQFLYPKTKKYSLLYLVHSAYAYIPPKLTQKELLDKVLSCPENKVFSMDLMIYVGLDIPKQYSGIIPIVSNTEISFEYIYHLLFGCNSKIFSEWLFKRKGYLCIDNGKVIPTTKIQSYVNVDRRCMIVSSTSDIFVYSVKLISKYVQDTTFEILENTSESSSSNITTDNKTKRKSRKTIPKAIKNQLWRKHFGNSMKGRCVCCQNEIDALEGWEAGHVEAVANGGSDHIDNLRPVCSTCNKSMSTMNLNEYIRRYHSK
tara:strand:+ start:321 stop:1391 length:1071 start_codon:yes stop_codon:yes gene_type:complete